MTQDYVPPQYRETAFNCPHCGAYAHQRWFSGIYAHDNWDGTGKRERLSLFTASICARCQKCALWQADQLVLPHVYVAPLPTSDIPENVKRDYEEARAIFGQSPRGAAALLRLAIQKLVVALGESGDNLNEAIGNLVKKGLRENVQKALDVVRVIGNNAVHPGLIDIKDNPKTALSLFKLTNLIVEQMITEPREVNELFESLPKEAKDAIAKRDKKTKSG